MSPLRIRECLLLKDAEMQCNGAVKVSTQALGTGTVSPSEDGQGGEAELLGSIQLFTCLPKVRSHLTFPLHKSRCAESDGTGRFWVKYVNVSHKRADHTSELITLPRQHHLLLSITMPQLPDLESLSRADRLILAIQAMKSDTSLSQRRAAATYNVPQSTLSTRRAKTPARRDIHPNSSKLVKHEEETIVRYIRKLDARGFAPTLSYVREMADQLLAARGGTQVGQNWATNFIRRKPGIKSQVTRQGDLQRVLCSDLAIISPWFDLVRSVKATYGILDEDTYNFDETGF